MTVCLCDREGLPAVKWSCLETASPTRRTSCPTLTLLCPDHDLGSRRPATDDPEACLLSLTAWELSDFRGGEVRNRSFGDVTQVRVGDDGDLLDVLVVVVDESDVGHQRAEAVPAGEMGHLEDEAGEVAVRLDPGSTALARSTKSCFCSDDSGRTCRILFSVSNVKSIMSTPGRWMGARPSVGQWGLAGVSNHPLEVR